MSKKKTTNPKTRGTRIGMGLFRWRSWVTMSPLARSLWLGLYASPAARRCPLGLWEGGVGTMADAAALAVADVEIALAELERATDERRPLFVFDRALLIGRLTEIPDACEDAYSGDVVSSWWTRFTTFPACDVRDDHVAFLYAHSDMTIDHVREWWADTFGTLTPVVKLPVGPRIVGRDPQGGGEGGYHPGKEGGRSPASADFAAAIQGDPQGGGESLVPDMGMGLDRDPTRAGTLVPTDPASSPLIAPPPPPRDLVQRSGPITLAHDVLSAIERGHAVISERERQSRARFGTLPAPAPGESNTERHLK